MTTHPTLEQRTKELLDELETECKCKQCADTVERHLTSFANEAVNATAESMRDECLKLICRYQSLHPEWVSELIGKVAYVEPDQNWLQRHDAAVVAKAMSKLVSCLKALVDKLTAIEPYVNNMCVLENIHGRPYSVPNWAKEIADAKQCLATLEKEVQGS